MCERECVCVKKEDGAFIKIPILRSSKRTLLKVKKKKKNSSDRISECLVGKFQLENCYFSLKRQYPHAELIKSTLARQETGNKDPAHGNSQAPVISQ